MHMRNAFEYAIIRVMPRIERGEFLNVGALLFCRQKRFLQARINLDEIRLKALWPELDPAPLHEQLAYLAFVCVGGKEAGPIGELPIFERFRWLTAPRSTVVQTSPVHGGICADPTEALERIFKQMVE
ncbi:MAG: DUF3037 domain-containing protein [Oscillochloris sp.]|nr:DUF3037 domain-containing protein [Oscillochloris sp.]